MQQLIFQSTTESVCVVSPGVLDCHHCGSSHGKFLRTSIIRWSTWKASSCVSLRSMVVTSYHEITWWCVVASEYDAIYGWIIILGWFDVKWSPERLLSILVVDPSVVRRQTGWSKGVDLYIGKELCMPQSSSGVVEHNIGGCVHLSMLGRRAWV